MTPSGDLRPPGGLRWPVAVLGATGAVGQTFVRRLRGHPWFDLVEVAASERSAGRPYAQAVRWLGDGPVPHEVAARPVLACDPAVVQAPIIFSALDASVAGDVEPAFARAGRLVLSNAKTHRMWDDVPLVVPDVNADHQAVLVRQREGRGWPGGIVTNANCAAAVAAMALKPLHEAFALETCLLTTLQAVSGAGYPGVPSLDILGNVIPHIADEEPKIEAELPKLLGALRGDAITAAPVRVSAQATRVPVEHGHTVCLAMAFARRPSVAEAREVLAAWAGPPGVRGLPSAPARPLIVADAADRPQPRRDVLAGDGMSVVVGRLREDPVLHLRAVALGHNVVVGAAGASVLNAEWLATRGLLPPAAGA